MKGIKITIIDEVTKGSIEANIVYCNDAYKRKIDNEVETYLDLTFEMSSEILYFLKYVYQAGHKISLEGKEIGDAYKDMNVCSYRHNTKFTMSLSLSPVESISIILKNKSNIDNTQHIGLYGDNGSSLISDNIKVISCDNSYIDNLRLVRRTKDIMFDADHHNLCLGINGKYKIIKYHGNMKIYERDIIIKDIRTLAGDWFEYEIEY